MVGVIYDFIAETESQHIHIYENDTIVSEAERNYLDILRNVIFAKYIIVGIEIPNPEDEY
jgi:hypothetical protein